MANEDKWATLGKSLAEAGEIAARAFADFIAAFNEKKENK